MHGVQPAHQHDLEHVVEALGVRAGQRDERQDLLQVGQQRRAQQRAPRQRPTAVALDGVDLAVVSQVAERVRQAPLGKGVRREPLVENHDRRLEPRILQVGVELRQMLWHHHALEHQRAGRQAGHVEHRIRPHLLFREAPRHEELAVERSLVHVRDAAVHKHLLDVRKRLQRLSTTRLRVHGHGAPAGELQPCSLQLRRERPTRRIGERRVAIQEHQARGKLLRELDASLCAHRAQKRFRFLQQQTAAIACLTVGGDCTAVGQAIQRGHGGADQPVARPIVETGNQAKSAAVAFVSVFVESLGTHRRGLAVDIVMSCGRDAACGRFRKLW